VASLFVIRGNDQGRRFELVGPVVRVGRDRSNAVQLHDSEVSRVHAELRHTDPTYTIRDLGSSNGTFVNGRRVHEHSLTSGDQLQLGRSLLLFTGAPAESVDELADSVQVAAADAAHESQIVGTLPQAEGSRILDFDAELPENSWLARARSNLQVMYRTALAVSHTLDIEQLLQRIMELIFEWVEADRGCIMLIDAETGQLEPKVRRTRGRQPDDEKITISRTILDYVVRRNEGVLTSDARSDQRWQAGASVVQAGIREAICVPMQGRYDVVGVIYIDTLTPAAEVIRQGKPSARFTADHLKLMIAIAHQAALAVEDTRYYSAMVQAERLAAIGQTVATLSHHIKNILQGIRGGSYLIEMGLAEHDESVVAKGWNIVEKNQQKISSLVLDMLTFSKERKPDLTTAKLDQTVSEVIELVQGYAHDQEVALGWQPSGRMPDMVFDPEGLHRAVLNVVTHAIDAAGEVEPPGRVEVRSEYLAQQSLVQIVVEDTGPGIPPEHVDKLFSPFVSFKGARGTGLGLPVSQKILSEHGGRILVDSQPGQGARFTLELPAVLPRPDAGSTRGQVPAGQTSGRSGPGVETSESQPREGRGPEGRKSAGPASASGKSAG